MRELVKCGALNLNGDTLDILCDSGTGTCYYKDITQGGGYEITGLEIKRPRNIGTEDEIKFQECIEYLGKEYDIDNPIGLVRYGSGKSLHLLYEEGNGFIYTLDVRADGTPVDPFPIDLHVDAELPPLDYGDGDFLYSLLRETLPSCPEDVLRTYTYRMLRLLGLTNFSAEQKSRWDGGLANVDTRELAKLVGNPKAVIDVVFDVCSEEALSQQVSSTYSRILQDRNAVYRMACAE